MKDLALDFARVVGFIEPELSLIVYEIRGDKVFNPNNTDQVLALALEWLQTKDTDATITMEAQLTSGDKAASIDLLGSYYGATSNCLAQSIMQAVVNASKGLEK